MRKGNTRFSLILVSLLILVMAVFLCSCGVNTENLAGSASQVNQSDEIVEDELDEDEDIYEGIIEKTDEDIEEDYDDFDDEDYDSDEEYDYEDAEDDPDEESQDSEEPVIEYVLNTNTKKFHYPDCRSVKQMKDKNKLVVEATRDDIISRGYDPCGNCHP